MTGKNGRICASPDWGDLNGFDLANLTVFTSKCERCKLPVYKAALWTASVGNRRKSSDEERSEKFFGAQIRPYGTAEIGRMSPTGMGGPNVVAIDNKIEQAMDLVKTHLMYAVREEVELLRLKITELETKVMVLERENSILREQVPPEILAKLLPPTLPPAAQPQGQGQGPTPSSVSSGNHTGNTEQ